MTHVIKKFRDWCRNYIICPSLLPEVPGNRTSPLLTFRFIDIF